MGLTGYVAGCVVSELLRPTKSGMHVLAFRVRMGPESLKEGPDRGGIHIAPALGAEAGIDLLYRAQWQQTVLGYIVDAV